MLNIDSLRLQIDALIRDNPILEDDEELRRGMLDGETEISGVLTVLLRATDSNLLMIDAIGDRMDQLAARRDRFKRRFEVLRALMLSVLQAADLKKFELPEATISQRNSQPQLLGDVDADTLPDSLCNIVREPSRGKIRAALLKGDVVPGMTLSNAAPSLAVNRK